MSNDETEELFQTILRLEPGGAAYETSLDTSSQVIRRVTDGIYRKPWSAIRELVSNSYDADAGIVRIETDFPRFESLKITDDGVGFSDRTLAHMIKNIGGSAKRSNEGVHYGIADPNDRSKTIGGRKLIGKLGIGLFAVSQLTHEFTVITKQKGDAFRTIADVLLFRHKESGSESKDAHSGSSDNQAASESVVFQTGSAIIYRVAASDKEEHGTSVLLRNLLPATRQELSSYHLWHKEVDDTLEDNTTNEIESDGRIPRFHVGCVDPNDPDQIIQDPELPWDLSDEPLEKFGKLVSKFSDVSVPNAGLRPSIEKDLDNYLQFIWNLSLAAPLPYLWKHPFDVTSNDGVKVFQFANYPERSAVPVELGNGTIREKLGLVAGEEKDELGFRILVDDIELKRPLGINTDALKSLQERSQSKLTPLLFVGRFEPELSEVASNIRGGDLRFEAYLLWREKTTPKEHAGVLIRVNRASGTLFDRTFLDYLVAENSRKQQATMELFVMEGVDAALNIDRESFNTFHPHYQLVRDWVHRSFRQFATRDKGERKQLQKAKEHARQTATVMGRSEIAQQLVEAWDESAAMPKVRFEESLIARVEHEADELVYSRPNVFPELASSIKLSARDEATLAQQQSVIETLASYFQSIGLFHDIERHEQERILHDVRNIIFFEAKE